MMNKAGKLVTMAQEKAEVLNNFFCLRLEAKMYLSLWDLMRCIQSPEGTG